jgi:N-methylhydantoinase B
MLKTLDEFAEGDIVVSNDPYTGGQHLLDVQFFAPLLRRGTPGDRG